MGLLALINLLAEALTKGVAEDAIRLAIRKLMVELADRQMKEELSDE